MKFGIVLPNVGATASRMALIDTLMAAEALGFDSVWVSDHIAIPDSDAGQLGNIYESITTLSYLAGLTRTIKLGVSALVLPQRNPVEMAKSIATLDVLSGGRTIVAAGIGWSEGEFRNLGYSFNDRAQRMSEYLRILRTIWRGQAKVNFQGKYFQLSNMAFSPSPIQTGGPPLWVAGNSIKSLRRAIHLADGWHPLADTPENIGSLLKQVRPLIANRPFTIAVRFNFSPDPQIDLPGVHFGESKKIIDLLNCYKIIGMNYAVIAFSATSQIERERLMKKFANEIMPNY